TVRDWAWDWLEEVGYDLETMEDDEEAARLFIVTWLSERGYDPELLQTDEIYTRRSVVREWLRERGWDPDAIFPTNTENMRKSDWVPFDQEAINVVTREWYSLMLEKHGEDLPEDLRVDPKTLDL